jgi:chaperonin GroEL (HSP60 family)
MLSRVDKGTTSMTILHGHGLKLSSKDMVCFTIQPATIHRHGLELSVKELVDFAAKSAISHRHGLELSCKNFVEFKVLFFLIDVGIN